MKGLKTYLRVPIIPTWHHLDLSPQQALLEVPACLTRMWGVVIRDVEGGLVGCVSAAQVHVCYQQVTSDLVGEDESKKELVCFKTTWVPLDRLDHITNTLAKCQHVFLATMECERTCAFSETIV